MGGNPIMFNDPLGDIIKYEGGIIFQIKARAYVTMLSLLSKSSRDRIKSLKSKENSHVHTIKKAHVSKRSEPNPKKGSSVRNANKSTENYDDSPLDGGLLGKGTGNGTDSHINLDLSFRNRRGIKKSLKGEGNRRGGGFYLLRELAHEFKHAEDIDQGELDRSLDEETGVMKSEIRAVHAENKAIYEMKLFKKNTVFRTLNTIRKN